MEPIRAMADDIVDTTDMTVHELRHFFMDLSRERARAPLVVNVVSFGFKHGIPLDTDLLFDARCLPNPHFVPELRVLTGRDDAIAAFLEAAPDVPETMERLLDLLRFLLPRYQREGKSYVTVGIGCTGGRHRSVYFVDQLTERLAAEGFAVRASHRDVER